MNRNLLVVRLHAAARTAAQKALSVSIEQGHSPECPSSLTRHIVRDLTNYPKVVVETRLIHLAVLLTYVVLIMILVGASLMLRFSVDLPVLASLGLIFILTMLLVFPPIVFGFINYKIKSFYYYGSHYL